MKVKRNDTGTPQTFQPLGKDFPPGQVDVTGQKLSHLVEGAASYENDPGNAPFGDPNLRRKGQFEVPDDDLAGEGWTPPTRPGGGWEHPVEPPLEERLDTVEN